MHTLYFGPHDDKESFEALFFLKILVERELS